MPKSSKNLLCIHMYVYIKIQQNAYTSIMRIYVYTYVHYICICSDLYLLLSAIFVVVVAHFNCRMSLLLDI